MRCKNRYYCDAIYKRSNLKLIDALGTRKNQENLGVGSTVAGDPDRKREVGIISRDNTTRRGWLNLTHSQVRASGVQGILPRGMSVNLQNPTGC